MRHGDLVLKVYERVGEGEILGPERVEQTLDRRGDGLVGMLPVLGHGRAAVAGTDGLADDLSATRKAQWTGGVFGGRCWRDVVGVRLDYPGQGPRDSVVPGAGNGV